MRMLIWTPLNAAELQKSMHGANVGPAALVPVQSGTVLLPSPDTKYGEAVLMTSRVRRLSRGAVLLVWDERATLFAVFTKTVGRSWGWGAKKELHRLGNEARQSGPVGKAFARLVEGLRRNWFTDAARAKAVDQLVQLVPDVDRAAVDERLADHANGAGSVPALCQVLGLPEVVQVAELVEQGKADVWLAPLAPPRGPQWPLALSVAFFVLCALVGQMFYVPPELRFSVLVLSLVSMGLASQLSGRAVVRRKPVNTVLPVIPVTQGAVPTD